MCVQGSRLIFPTGHTFATNFLSWSHELIIWLHLFMFFDNIWLINACWWTFIIVYSYVVTKLFNIQPVLFYYSIICDLNFVNRNSFFPPLSFVNNLISVIKSEVKTVNYWTNINFNCIKWPKKRKITEKRNQNVTAAKGIV